MSKLYDLKEIIEATGLPERTVRYYLSQLLEAPSGTPGRKSYYDQHTVNQLQLAKQVLMRDYDPDKGEVKPTLREFRDWLDNLGEREVQRLVEMPYRTMPAFSLRGRPARATQARPEPPAGVSYNLPPEAALFANKNEAFKATRVSKKDSAAHYLDRLTETQQPGAAGRPAPQAWHTHRFGDQLEIRTRKPLSREQQHQLQLAGELLKTIIEGA
jgi:DNA-binding transcriptional MerR regulator